MFPYVVPGIRISSNSRLGTIITTIATGLLIETLYNCFIRFIEIPLLGREADELRLYPGGLYFLDFQDIPDFRMNWIMDCPLRMAATSVSHISTRDLLLTLN